MPPAFSQLIAVLGEHCHDIFRPGDHGLELHDTLASPRGKSRLQRAALWR